MYCSNCGTERENNVQACRQCGQAFGPGDAVPAPANSDVLHILRSLTGADLSHDRINAIVRQALGLLALMVAVFAIARKPNPGVFILYALPPLLGGIVIVLERRASVGKAVFVLAMLVPYVTLFLLGVPPIFVSGLQNLDKVAAGLGGFFGSVGAATAFLVAGFLFLIFSSMATQIFPQQPLIAGSVALALTALFTLLFMAMLGSPANMVRQSITIDVQLDKNIKIYTTALAPGEDGKLAEAADFKSNELIYPYVGGMTAGAHFGIRVLDDAGMAVVPFDRSDAVRAKGTGLDKFPAFNTVDGRLNPGTYTLELLVTQGWKTTVMSRARVSVSEDVNPNYGSQAGDDYAWLSGEDGKAATTFAAAGPVHLILDGSRLQGSVSIRIKDNTDLVKLDKDYDAMPLGRSDYVLAEKASDLGAGQFVAVITSEGKQPLTIYFTIQ